MLCVREFIIHSRFLQSLYSRCLVHSYKYVLIANLLRQCGLRGDLLEGFSGVVVDEGLFDVLFSSRHQVDVEIEEELASAELTGKLVDGEDFVAEACLLESFIEVLVS